MKQGYNISVHCPSGLAFKSEVVDITPNDFYWLLVNHGGYTQKDTENPEYWLSEVYPIDWNTFSVSEFIKGLLPDDD